MPASPGAPATTSPGPQSAVVFPVEEDTGAAAEPVDERARNAHVLYLAIASETEIDLARMMRIEDDLRAAAERAGPEAMPRGVAERVRAEHVLELAAVRYVYVEHGRGARGD